MDEPYAGQIQLFPYSYAPEGWAFCEGQLLKVEEYQLLYALLGNKFGGNGWATFGLPNLKGKEPAPDLRYCIALNGLFPIRP